MGAECKGVRLSLCAAKNSGPQSFNTCNYDENGGPHIFEDRKARHQSAGHVTDARATRELRLSCSILTSPSDTG